MAQTYEILFTKPIKIEAGTPAQAMTKFASMLRKCAGVDRLFYATTKTETERDMDNLAEFFVSNWGDELSDTWSEETGNVIPDDQLYEIAERGVDYWYSGNVDGTQYDCLMLGFQDWRNEQLKNRY